jgi:hypothetical protein
MNSVDSSAVKDELALSAYAGVKLFAAVADKLKTVNASTVLAALTNAKVGAYDIGLTAPVPGAKTSPVDGLAGLAFSPSVTYNQIQNGKLIQSEAGFQDPFAAS